MQLRRCHIAIPIALVLAAGCDQFSLTSGSDFSIEEISPDTVRADKPKPLTITGSGLGDVDWVGFGFAKSKTDRDEISAVEKFKLINASTIEVMPPELPGLHEKKKVWVSVGGKGFDESEAVAVVYRPANVIDLYGIQALVVIGGVAAVWTVFLLIRRGYRRMALRHALLEAKGQRLALRDERRAKAVLAEIAAEKEAAQAKLEAEYLPYADKAAGKGAED